MSNKPQITGITVSVSFGDKQYGSGTDSFMNIQTRYPETGKSIEELDDVIADGLDLYFAAWRTILASRFATGQITVEVDGKTKTDSEGFRNTLASTAARIEKVRKFLRKSVTTENG